MATFRLRAPIRRALVALAAAASVAATAGPAAAVTGPDVASFQHPSGTSINWTTVKSTGQSFVFVKATEGTTYTNPYFAGDWASSHTAGLIHGAYHFARPSVGSAVSQAKHFIAVAGVAHGAGDLAPTLDLETTGGLSPAQLITWTQQFMSEVTALTGRTPILYTYPYFWQHSMANSTAFTRYPLWIASYSSSPTTLVWPTWTFWQYSSTSSVRGISGQVDMDAFNGTLAQLQRLANITPTVAVTPKLTARRPVVTARLSSAATTVGHAVTMSATVKPFRSGQRVYRQGYYSGGWHTWAIGTVSSTGTVRFTIRPTVRAVDIYRLYLPGTTGLTSATSPTLRLTVR